MENSYTPNADPNENILDDVDYTLYQAGSGKRFANYLIDVFVFVILMIIFFIILAFVQPNALRAMVDDNNSGANLLFQLVFSLGYAVYMWIFEMATGGKSLGKLITGTRAVNQDGSRISAKTALLRSLSRLVPFEGFSALGSPSHPWHDRWTDTYVVDEKMSRLPTAQV